MDSGESLVASELCHRRGANAEGGHPYPGASGGRLADSARVAAGSTRWELIRAIGRWLSPTTRS